MLWTDKLSIILTLFLAAGSCSLVGVHLALRRQSMFSDALSHSVLPGLVIAFLISDQLSGLPIFLGALAAGLLTSFLSELFRTPSKIHEDASVGIVFSGMFALGVFLLTTFAGQAHLDTSCVLFGEVALVPLESPLFEIGELGIGNTIRNLLLGWLCVGTFLGLLKKEFLISAFQPELAKTQGVPVRLFHYLLMVLASITIITAFESLGAILVISLIVIPPAFGRLLSHQFHSIYLTGLVFSALSIAMGVELAARWNLNIAAVVTSIQFLTFLLLFATKLRWPSRNKKPPRPWETITEG
jgi:manganese/zinc/iron transport system permease protein